jgi:exosortase
MTAMSTANVSRIPKAPRMHVVQTLWDQRSSMSSLSALGAATLTFILAYLPNLRVLLTLWNEDTNYTHGYLVLPIAGYILWQQLSTPVPKTSSKAIPAPWWGWVFLCMVLVLRAVMYERGSQWLENSTMILAVAALTWSFGSWPLLQRVWPAIGFLVFMFPLPGALNELLALPLQSIAATSSAFLLQLTGMWVIQDGNVINLSTAHGMEKLDVALACNGLRMLMTMAATVIAAVIVIPLPRWKRIVLVLSVVPVALVSNMARIVGTGWSYYLFEGAVARHSAHDWAGYMMMPLALALVGVELGVMSWLVPKENEDEKLVNPVLHVSKKDSGKPSVVMTKKHSGKSKNKIQDLD